MCDTIVALGNATSDGSTIFGKNSDREPDETQNLCIFPFSSHLPGESVRCTYVSIPQVSETNKIFLCRPFWMWGGEMGINQHGVAIGNEALFTKEKPDKNGLTGMDLVRLALERSRTAAEARDVLIQLIEKHGQGGNCGYRLKFYYMNGFIIADQNEAYVLETVKRWWAWKKIDGFWSISNAISLENDFDACSPGLIENAIEKGWCRKRNRFNFRRCYSDRIYTCAAASRKRQSRTYGLLSSNGGKNSIQSFLSILRDHGCTDHPNPQKDGITVCMHAANKLIRRSQTVGSMVSKLDGEKSVILASGASSPCIRPFFPVSIMEDGLPEKYGTGGAFYDPSSFWWAAERLHRKSLNSFEEIYKTLNPVIQEHERKMIEEIECNPHGLKQEAIDGYFSSVEEINKLQADTILHKIPGGKRGRVSGSARKAKGYFYRRYWRKYNKADGLSG